MLSEVLFDTPWWLPVLLIGVGLAGFMSGNRRQDKRILYAGSVVALLGMGVAVTSYLMETDRERAASRTRKLVAAVNQRDWPTFRALLDKQTTVYVFRGPDSIAEAARTAVERYRIANVRITGLEIEQRDTLITVSIRVLSDLSGGSVVTDWQLQYQDFGQGWVLQSVRALSNQQINENRIREEINRQ